MPRGTVGGNVATGTGDGAAGERAPGSPRGSAARNHLLRRADRGGHRRADSRDAGVSVDGLRPAQPSAPGRLSRRDRPLSRRHHRQCRGGARRRARRTPEPPARSRCLRRHRRSGGNSQRAGSAPARRDRDRPWRCRRSDAGEAGAARRQCRRSPCRPRGRRVERRRLGVRRDEHAVHRSRQRLDDDRRLDPLDRSRRAGGQPQAAGHETLGARAHRPAAVRRVVRGHGRAGRTRHQLASRHARAGTDPRGRRQGGAAARRHARRRILAAAGGPSRAGLVAARPGLRQDVPAVGWRGRRRRDPRARLHAAHGSREAVTEHGRPVPAAGRSPRRSVDAPVDSRSEAVERAVRAAVAGQPEALDPQRRRRPAAAQFRRGARTRSS